MECLVHNSTRHTASECREIKKLAEQFHEKMQQQSRQDGAPSLRLRVQRQLAPQDTPRHVRGFLGHYVSVHRQDPAP
jgi:hypothetical protein